MHQVLKGKNAFITGAASGIGLGIAAALAEEGANVVVSDIDKEALSDIDRKLAGLNVKKRFELFDVADFNIFENKVEILETEFGEIDILVNNAGVTSTTVLEEMTPEEWDFIFDVNLKGAFFLSKEFGCRMRKRGYGRIINIGSISGERGAKYAGPHYSISKAGVIMMTKVFAKYFGDSGVTVNTVSPGIISTEMTNRLKTQVDPTDIPLNRMGTIDDVAAVVLFLASDAAGYITGQNISVNGGQSMR
jgi:3-oxoacyl-[acyl-carrier protein] reductase